MVVTVSIIVTNLVRRKMTTKMFEDYKDGTYNPYNGYYIELHKPVLIPTHIERDNECWFGPNNPYTYKEIISKEHQSTHINVNRWSKYEKRFDGDYIIYTIYPEETIQVKMEDGKFDYRKKYLEPYEVKVHYKNIKIFH